MAEPTTVPKPTIWGGLRQRLFGIQAGETSFERRGFRGGTPALRRQLETVGASFVHGYHAALADSRPAGLVPRLAATPEAFRGFAYEGAAMGLALLDWLTPWRRPRIHQFLRGAGHAHAYMIHVGAGWLLARVPGSVDRFLARFDPLLRWLVMDGYGFHEAFFHFPEYLGTQTVPPRATGYARRAFDQGFGRCLWFVEGAEVPQIQATIARFPASRHGDFWSGVGLAAAYAGELEAAGLRALRQAAGPHWPALAQGAAFAAKARWRAGNPTTYTRVACGQLCDLDDQQAAEVTDLALENLPVTNVEPAYEEWRRRIQRHFAGPPLKRTQ